MTQLRRAVDLGLPIAILDVRETDPFVQGHLPRSIHTPDSDAAGLAREVRRHRQLVLVCADGRQSAMVARTLKFSALAEAMYLVGGVKAWADADAPLFETSTTGQEHRVSTEAALYRRVAAVAGALNLRLVFAAAAAAAVIVGLAMRLAR